MSLLFSNDGAHLSGQSIHDASLEEADSQSSCADSLNIKPNTVVGGDKEISNTGQNLHKTNACYQIRQQY